MKNKFKAALLETDSPLIGCWLGLADPYAAELCATAAVAANASKPAATFCKIVILFLSN